MRGVVVDADKPPQPGAPGPYGPFAWLSLDYAPSNAWEMSFIGFDVTVADAALQAINDLNATRSAMDVYTEQLTSLTGLRTVSVQGSRSEVGFSIYSTVYDDDPTRVVLSMGASLNAYVSGINAGDQAVVTVTDHFGEVYLHATGCVEADAVQVLSGVVNITSTKRWRVDIGQCPSFTDGYIASSTKRTTASLIVGAICAAAVLMCTGLVVIVHVSEKDAKLRITVATHTESSRAHRWIIGYGTSSFRVAALLLCSRRLRSRAAVSRVVLGWAGLSFTRPARVQCATSFATRCTC